MVAAARVIGNWSLNDLLISLTATQKQFIFARWKWDHKLMSAMPFVKGGHLLLSHLLKMKRIIGGRITFILIKDTLTLLRKLNEIDKAQGRKGLIIFLKTLSVSIQQISGGYTIKDQRLIGSRFSRTNFGIPRIFTPYLRKMLKERNPYFIRYILTILNLYRILDMDYKESLSTIISEGTTWNTGKYFQYIDLFLNLFIPRRLDSYSKRLSFLVNKFNSNKYFIILRSSPESNPFWSTHPKSLLKSIWALNGQGNEYIKMAFSQLCSLYASNLQWNVNRITGASPFGKVENSDIKLELPIKELTKVEKPFNLFINKLKLGALGFKKEAAGKLRVFAMVDPFTQWLLYPLHKLIFCILRSVPMDGTFNQLKPIYRLLNMKCNGLYSLDLSAATDRLPILLQKEILNKLFLPYLNGLFGTYWGDLLVGRYYHYTFPDSKKSGNVKYKVGQPMGALSSWAMLALTHHFLVQVAAWRSGAYSNYRLFSKYALLGDDLVLGDRRVAAQYLVILNELGVNVGLAKSIISKNKKFKGVEFAKKTLIVLQGKIHNVSPIPFKEINAALSDITQWAAFSNLYKIPFNKQASLLGYGYKTETQCFRKLNHALKVLFLANIAKCNINSEFLNLGQKVPKEIDQLLPDFKAKVLKPVMKGIMLDMNALIEIGRKFYPPKSDPLGIYFNPTLDPLFGIPSKRIARFNYETLEYLVRFQGIIKGTKVLKEAHLMLHDLNSIKDMNEALNIMFKVSRIRTQYSREAIDLKFINRLPSTTLPYQIRLFRAWSRLVHKLVRKSQNIELQNSVKQ
jgi:hypothetical protein